jgi:hypothetical protein
MITVYPILKLKISFEIGCLNGVSIEVIILDFLNEQLALLAITPNDHVLDNE